MPRLKKIADQSLTPEQLDLGAKFLALSNSGVNVEDKNVVKDKEELNSYYTLYLYEFERESDEDFDLNVEFEDWKQNILKRPEYWINVLKRDAPYIF